MYKSTSKFSLCIAFCLLSIMVLGLVSSVLLYRQLPGEHSRVVNSDLIDFIDEFKYELVDTSTVFAKAYRSGSNNAINREFDECFSNMLNRASALSLLRKNNPNVEEKINTRLINYNIQKIRGLIYHSEVLAEIPLETINTLFNEIHSELHLFQLNWGSQNKYSVVPTFGSAAIFNQGIILLIFITLILGLVMSFYFLRNNRKLLELQRTMEMRVYERTKELNYSNTNLHQEINERKKAEQALTESQRATQEVNQRLKQQTNYDQLTKLANRQLFIERFKEASRRADRNNNLVSLLFLDLDQFKYVNDTLGHSVGDELLKEAALRIQDVLRSTDSAARFGGDEFCVVLSDLEEISTVEIIVGRILKTLSNPFHLSGTDAFVSASIGIATYPTDGDNYQSLITKADSAMYKAKDAGSNNYQFFTQQMDVEATERKLLENSLFKAVEQGQFAIEYLPIIDITTRQTSAFEALLYWNHPTEGKLSADKFIPLAEETGLILDIGEWLLLEACKSAVAESREGNDSFIMSVNISARQFQKSNMLEVIESVIRGSGLAADRLMIEITEELLIAQRKQCLEQLNQIANLGVQIAIDQFGTGYSSLSFLKKYPITAIKIDQSFVEKITLESADEVLIQGILSMADKLQLSVIASGVNDISQLRFLNQHHCRFAQGELFSGALQEPHSIPFLKAVENTPD